MGIRFDFQANPFAGVFLKHLNGAAHVSDFVPLISRGNGGVDIPLREAAHGFGQCPCRARDHERKNKGQQSTGCNGDDECDRDQPKRGIGPSISSRGLSLRECRDDTANLAGQCNKLCPSDIERILRGDHGGEFGLISANLCLDRRNGIRDFRESGTVRLQQIGEVAQRFDTVENLFCTNCIEAGKILHCRRANIQGRVLVLVHVHIDEIDDTEFRRCLAGNRLGVIGCRINCLAQGRGLSVEFHQSRYEIRSNGSRHWCRPSAVRFRLRQFFTERCRHVRQFLDLCRVYAVHLQLSGLRCRLCQGLRALHNGRHRFRRKISTFTHLGDPGFQTGDEVFHIRQHAPDLVSPVACA